MPEVISILALMISREEEARRELPRKRLIYDFYLDAIPLTDL
jgi:hypothetical protein